MSRLQNNLLQPFRCFLLFIVLACSNSCNKEEIPPEITYPESTNFGINILNQDATEVTYKSGTGTSYSVAADVPAGASLRIRIKFWGCNDWVCWEFNTSPDTWGEYYSSNCEDALENCDSKGELLNFRRNYSMSKSTTPKYANDQIIFMGTSLGPSDIVLSIFENGSKTPQFTKFISWEP